MLVVGGVPAAGGIALVGADFAAVGLAAELPGPAPGDAGFGKDMSHESLLEYTATHHIMIKHSEPVKHDSFRPA